MKEIIKENFLTYLQAIKLACHDFTFTNRTYETSGTEKGLCIRVHFPCPLSPMGMTQKHTRMNVAKFPSLRERINRLWQIHVEPSAATESTYLRYTQQHSWILKALC